MALIENRTLISPMAACKCMVRRTGSAALGQEGSASGQAGTRGRLAVCADPQEVGEPIFGCSLKPSVREVLNIDAWHAAASTWRLAGVHVRPASFLDNDLPMSIKRWACTEEIARSRCSRPCHALWAWRRFQEPNCIVLSKTAHAKH